MGSKHARHLLHVGLKLGVVGELAHHGYSDDGVAGGYGIYRTHGWINVINVPVTNGCMSSGRGGGGHARC